jgi:hypothetical protein
MKKIILLLPLFLTSNFTYASDNEAIQKDLKFLCEINKVEKNLSRDKSIDPADLAEKISSMKEAATRSQEVKDALKGMAVMDPKERTPTWRKFAKEHGFKKMECL